jgi:aryl-alcohol dehydrogenase-like predicted oxidoreductase
MIQQSQYRTLGTSGMFVSPLGVGTNRWMLGKRDDVVFQTFQSSVNAGVNFFDTAEVYTSGKSERLLGMCVQRDRRPVLIASKFAPLPTRLSRRQFMHALDASLNRLGVQTIDLYYLHWPFTLLRIETLMDWMAQAVEAGKIRAVGVSNCTAPQMRRAAERLAHFHIPLAANEVHYSLLHRQPEVNGVLDACQELRVALVAYRPLEGGLFTSSAARGASAGLSSATRRNGKTPSKLQEILQAVAQQHGKSVNQVVLNWLLRRDARVIPIPGATSARHALENVDTLTWELSDEAFAAIDEASAPRKHERRSSERSKA